jgi:hypothetical protein
MQILTVVLSVSVIAWCKWILKVASVLGVACGVGLALAAAPWPNGWSVKRQDGGILATSPERPAGSGVSMYAHPPQKTPQPVRGWMDTQIAQMATGGASVVQRNGITAEGNLHKDVFNILSANGDKARVFAFAYPTPQGHQLVLVFAPLSMNPNEPRLSAAFDSIATLWRSGAPAQLAGTGDTAAPPAGSAANPRASTPPKQAPASSQANSNAGKGGVRCREELRMITTTQLQRVCYPSAGGMSNCTMQSVPVQQQVLQEVCY